MTLCINSLYSLQIPVSAAEEGKGWLVREKGPGWASASLCQSTSPCLHSQHSAILTGAFLPLLHWSDKAGTALGALSQSPLPGWPSCAGDRDGEGWGGTRIGDWRGWVTIKQAAAAFLLPRKSHCSEVASLQAGQISSLLNWLLPSSPVFSLSFLGAALAFVQHDLIHPFWWSNRFQSSDLSPWFHCSAVSSLPDLHLIWKTSLSQPFLTLALSPDHPMSPDLFDRNPTTRSLHMWSFTPPGPPEQGRTTGP